MPSYATSGALIYVSFLILSGLQKLDWTDLSELIPSLIIVVMIPLTFSIADGISLGFLLIAILTVRNIKGSIIISILVITLISLTSGLVEFNGVISYPPSLSPVFLKLDIIGAIDIAMISIIASFLFVNLFDTTGTLFGVATRANFIDEKGNISNLDKALKCDSSTSIIGTFFGCAPVTSYVCLLYTSDAADE